MKDKITMQMLIDEALTVCDEERDHEEGAI
jgi:hypothetical protein